MLCKRYLERAEVISQEWERMAQEDLFRGQNNGPTLQGSKGGEKEMFQHHKIMLLEYVISI